MFATQFGESAASCWDIDQCSHDSLMMSETDTVHTEQQPEVEAEELRDRLMLLLDEYDELEIRLRMRGEQIRPNWAASYARCQDLMLKYHDFTANLTLLTHPDTEQARSSRFRTLSHCVQTFKVAFKDLTRVVAVAGQVAAAHGPGYGPGNGPVTPVSPVLHQKPNDGAHLGDHRAKSAAHQVFEGNGHLVEISRLVEINRSAKQPADRESAHDSAAQLLAQARTDPMFRGHEHHVEIMLNPGHPSKYGMGSRKYMLLNRWKRARKGPLES